MPKALSIYRKAAKETVLNSKAWWSLELEAVLFTRFYFQIFRFSFLRARNFASELMGDHCGGDFGFGNVDNSSRNILHE